VRRGYTRREDERKEDERKEGIMSVITPGDKRRQVASGVVGVYEVRREEQRRDNESDFTCTANFPSCSVFAVD